jgi:ABC-2 type transport system permease protein
MSASSLPSQAEPELRAPTDEAQGGALPSGDSLLVERLPAGWRVIAAKELADHLLSVRLLLLVGILGVVGVLTIIAASSYIRDQANAIGDARGVVLALFTIAPPTSATTFQPPAFVSWIALLGPLLGIAFGFDAISSERAEGTLSRLVSQPIHRDDVINGKFVAGLTVVGMAVGVVGLLVLGVAMFRLAIIPQLDDILRLLSWYVVTVVYIGFWLALATLCSVVFRRAATAALVVIGIWLVLAFFYQYIADVAAGMLAPAATDLAANISRTQDILRLSPGTLYQEMTAALLNPSVRTVDDLSQLLLQFEPRAVATILPFGQSVLIIWPQVVALVAATVICFALAYVSFMRQEVRA